MNAREMIQPGHEEAVRRTFILGHDPEPHTCLNCDAPMPEDQPDYDICERCAESWQDEYVARQESR
jgi:hypothetical protein